MGRGQIKYDRTTRDRPKNWMRIPLTILIWTGLILMVAVKSAGAVLEVPSARSWIQVVIDDRCLFPWHVNGSKIRAVCVSMCQLSMSAACAGQDLFGSEPHHHIGVRLVAKECTEILRGSRGHGGTVL